MKKIKFLLIALTLVAYGTGLNAQNLDRVVISSGGISSDTINATIGEIFVFSISEGGFSLDAGSQSDEGNTGGIITGNNQNMKPQAEVLVYPNPVSDFLNLQIDGINSQTISFQVFDMGGRLIMQYNSVADNQLHRVNVAHLSSGNYVIHGYTPEGQSIGNIKFIKL